MSEPAAPQSPDLRDHAGHETTDASAFYVGLFAFGLALTILLALLFLDRLFWRFEAETERTDPVVSPLAGNQTPPEPRLQTRPNVDLAELRHAENETLGSYKWIDQQQGIVQIPIDRAIDLLSERGFPQPEAAEPIAPKQEATP